MELQEILEELGIERSFRLAVKEECEAIPAEIPQKEYKKREDLTAETIITIDGADAKDLDDAVSCRRLKGGRFLLGVHIADVSHYVTEESELDRSAMARGTSVYFPGDVIPMLPPKLSNGVCSLHPGEPKLTLSCEMVISGTGKVQSYRIFESVIRSSARLTYDEVTALLCGDMATRVRLKELAPLLEDMRALALLLRDRRAKRGSLDFQFPETKITVEEGKPVAIGTYEVGISNLMIEEFMLCANETVAAHLAERELPGIYRVHEDPDPEKIEGLKKLLALRGIRLKKGKGKIAPSALQQVLFSLEASPAKPVISTVMLRCMMKARYSPENLGHYGLAAENYCHFTSPIRRYPDLFVHRVLKEELHSKKGIGKRRRALLERRALEAADRSSETEVAAVDAERRWTDCLICEYMEPFLGQEFSGVISTVASFGFFVMLENRAEGLVFVSSLADDYYRFDEVSLTLNGERTGKQYAIGDEVRVRLVQVNREEAKLQLRLAEEKPPERKRQAEAKGPQQKRKGGRKSGRKRKGRRTKQKGKA